MSPTIIHGHAKLYNEVGHTVHEIQILQYKKLSASGHMFGATFRKNAQTCKIPLKLHVKFSNEHYVKFNKNLITIN